VLFSFGLEKPPLSSLELRNKTKFKKVNLKSHSHL